MIKYISGTYMTNTYIVDKLDSAFIIDPAEGLENFLEEIKKFNIKFILLTHGHVDHIDGIKHFNVPIYIHEFDYPFLFDDTLSLYYTLHKKSCFKDFNIIKIKNGDKIPFLDEKIEVIHTPGHTKGSVCYLYKNKLFSGDTLFADGCGRTDFPTGNQRQMDESLIKIIDELDDSIQVYPGHGIKTIIKDEKNKNFYYLNAKKRIK